MGTVTSSSCSVLSLLNPAGWLERGETVFAQPVLLVCPYGLFSALGILNKGPAALLWPFGMLLTVCCSL